jgi:hypothetical protein
LVLLIEDEVPADAELVNRVQRVFVIRRTHTVLTTYQPPTSGVGGALAITGRGGPLASMAL